MTINSSVYRNRFSEAWQSESQVDPLLSVLASEYASLSPDELEVAPEEILEKGVQEEFELPLEDAEGFFSNLGSFLKKDSIVIAIEFGDKVILKYHSSLTILGFQL